MSRIGKKPVTVPSGVTVSVAERLVEVKGPKGTLSLTVVPQVRVEVVGDAVHVSLSDQKSKKGPALWGLTRALIANMVTGVTHGFSKSLEINGVGFKVAVKGATLILHVGFSHPVEYHLPEGIQASVDKNMITVSGVDRQLVGQVAADIRAIRPPEPYKGKGIKYVGEVIRRKVGKVIKSVA